MEYYIENKDIEAKIYNHFILSSNPEEKINMVMSNLTNIKPEAYGQVIPKEEQDIFLNKILNNIKFYHEGNSKACKISWAISHFQEKLYVLKLSPAIRDQKKAFKIETIVSDNQNDLRYILKKYYEYDITINKLLEKIEKYFKKQEFLGGCSET